MNYWDSAAGHHLGERLSHFLHEMFQFLNKKQYYISKYNPDANAIEGIMDAQLEEGAKLVQTIRSADGYTIFVFEK